MDDQKKCSSCGCKFPPTTEYFHKDKYSRDGLRASCKLCVCERQQIDYLNNLEQERRRKREAYRQRISAVA